MFRPDRIGTPVIHTNQEIQTGTAWSPGTGNISAGTVYLNPINAVSITDFGQTTINYASSAISLPAFSRMAIGQQFTVTKPVNGDVRGIELNGQLNIAAPSGVTFKPCFGKIVSASGASMLTVQFATLPTYMGASDYSPNAVTPLIRTPSYQEQVVTRDISGGPYAHGIMIFNPTAAAFDFTYFNASFSVRQLNDQQNVGYADTRR